MKAIKSFDVHKVEYAVVGGIALVLHGVVRGTVDLDIVISVSKENFMKAEKAMSSLGLISRLPVNSDLVFKFRDEYIKERNLIAWSFYNPKNPTEVIDIIITDDLKMLKTSWVGFAGLKIKVLTINELIKMKKRAGREQDLADVRSLEELLKITKR